MTADLRVANDSLHLNYIPHEGTVGHVTFDSLNATYNVSVRTPTVHNQQNHSRDVARMKIATFIEKASRNGKADVRESRSASHRAIPIPLSLLRA